MVFQRRRRAIRRCERTACADLPTEYGLFSAHGYRDAAHAIDHVALTMGSLQGTTDVPLRVHSECLTGEAFRSARCDCGDQLTQAMAYVAERRLGLIIYLRGQEGRGIGIAAKLRAYSLQDHGADTVSANTMLGLPVDARDYSVVPHILRDLGVGSVELVTNNPDKVSSLVTAGVKVTKVRRTRPEVHPTNISYLRTKRDVLGHALALGDSP